MGGDHGEVSDPRCQEYLKGGRRCQRASTRVREDGRCVCRWHDPAWCEMRSQSLKRAAEKKKKDLLALKMTTQEALRFPLEDLSPRLWRIGEELGLPTFGDLSSITWKQLRASWNFGKVTEDLIRTFADRHGVKLGPGPLDPVISKPETRVVEAIVSWNVGKATEGLTKPETQALDERLVEAIAKRLGVAVTYAEDVYRIRYRQWGSKSVEQELYVYADSLDEACKKGRAKAPSIRSLRMQVERITIL